MISFSFNQRLTNEHRLSSDEAIHIFNPPYLPPERLASTIAHLKPTNPPPPTAASATTLQWTTPTPPSSSSHNVLVPHLTIQMQPSSGLIKQLIFHRRGDYFASVGQYYIVSFYVSLYSCLIGEHGGVWIHQMSKRNSQAPFRKIKGAVQRVQFHPSKPHFFVAVRTCLHLSIAYHSLTCRYITF